MKPLRSIAVFALVLGLGFGTAHAVQNVTVQVTNSTQYTMTQFYASDAEDSGWNTNNNLITGQTLAPGQTMAINIGSAEHCAFDLMAVLYGASQYAYQYSVDPCDGDTWTITQGQ